MTARDGKGMGGQIMACLAGIGLIATAVWLWRASEESSDSAVPTVAQQVTGEVSFSGGLARAVSRPGANIPFWISFRNDGDSPIRDFRLLTHQLGEYRLVGGCWCRAKEPSCLPPIPRAGNATPRPDAVEPGCERLIAELLPGQTLAVWGDLTTDVASAPSMVIFVGRWTRTDQSTSQVTIPLGYSRIRTVRGEWLVALRQLLKDLVLPLTLVGIGFLFNHWQKDRETRAQDAERRQQHVAQTWNLMLPKSHEYNTRFYIKLLRHAWRVVDSVRMYEAARDTTEAEERRLDVFYYWVLLRRHSLNLQNEAGFYFKDQTGEWLANLSGRDPWERFKRLTSHDEQAHLAELLKLVTLDDSHSDLLSKFGELPLAAECLAVFKSWMGSDTFEPALRSLRAFCAVLEYEINRPYEHWYGRPEKLKIATDAKTRLVELVQEQEAKEPYRNLQAETENYLSRGVGRS